MNKTKIRKKTNIFWKCYCRLYQFIFRIAIKLLPWRAPVIIEGENSMQQLSEILVKKRLSSILIVTGNNLYNLNITKQLESELKINKISYYIFKDVLSNPTIENVENTMQAYKDNNCQAIIALGGGSVIDCAKVAGARIVKPKKSVMKMAGVLKVLKKLPPLFAIPTTAGTGSEASLAAVITDPSSHRKFAINDLSLIPHYAVLDPHLTVNLPKAITAATGMDALTHAIESYIGNSNTKQTKNDAIKALKLIDKNLLESYENGNNIEARANMLKASHYAGRAFTKAYVGNIHAAAHTLSGFYNIPHGLANAVLLPHVLEYYENAVYKKLAQIADIIRIGQNLNSDEDKAKAFIVYIKNLNSKLEIPSKISGIKEEDLPQMIKNALKEANPLYPVPVIFNKFDFKNIFDMIKE